MHFFVSEFVDLLDDVPLPAAFVDALACLHHASMGKSPGGRLGFHVPTHASWIPHLPYPIVAAESTQ